MVIDSEDAFLVELMGYMSRPICKECLKLPHDRLPSPLWHCPHSDINTVQIIAKARCSRATGQWPCQDCIQTVQSVLDNINKAGYTVQQQ